MDPHLSADLVVLFVFCFFFSPFCIDPVFTEPIASPNRSTLVSPTFRLANERRQTEAVGFCSRRSLNSLFPTASKTAQQIDGSPEK